MSGGRVFRSGSRRSNAAVAGDSEALAAASSSRCAMSSTIRASPSTAGTAAGSSARPTSSANRRAAGSIRVTRPHSSNARMRAPMSSAVTSTSCPRSQTASFEVPPPTSRFITRAPSRIERATAPEPCAASVASSASPALTATNLPACAANSSPIARAFARRTATPVRISAPVSMCSGTRPASAYCLAMNAASAAPSIVASPAYGVSSTSDSWNTSRAVTR